MTTEARTPKAASLKPRIILLSFSFCFSVLLLEAGLWLVGFSFPVTTRRDKNRGYALLPNIKFEQKAEGRATVVTNSYGFRDDEWTLEKPENTVRIAVLGDSYVHASQVAKDERFTERLESRLRESVGDDHAIEVMNFGIDGYGTAQELMTFRHEVKPFKPDVVLLSVLTGNDIQNNSEALQRDPIRPYFIERDGRLVLDDSFRTQSTPLAKAVGLTAAKYSRLGQMAYRVYQTSKFRRGMNQMKQQANDRQKQLFAKGLAEPGLSTWIYREPQNEQQDRAWSATEHLIARFCQEVNAAGAEFLVVTLSNSVQVLPDRNLRQAFQHIVQSEDIFYPDRRIAAACEKAGVPSLALAPSLQYIAERDRTYLHGFANAELGKGHWNTAAHQVAGTLIARWMTKEKGRERGFLTETDDLACCLE